MKVIGLIGGMSWESTSEYYRIINRAVRARLGGQHSAKILLYSVDFEEIERYQRQGDWQAAGEQLAAAARRLERGGADFLLIGANTMHRVADQVQAAVGISLVHIADATAAAAERAGHRRLGLLGTRFTMEQAFYRDRLTRRHGLEVAVPGPAERAEVHRIIYQELCQGRIEASSKSALLTIIAGLRSGGAEAIVLGCTELPLLVGSDDTPVPVLDTTEIHALEAVRMALNDEQTTGGTQKAHPGHRGLS